MAIDSEEIKDEKNPRPLDEDDIALLKTYVNSQISLKP
jgi:26S proteasome regulatory subunit T1